MSNGELAQAGINRNDSAVEVVTFGCGRVRTGREKEYGNQRDEWNDTAASKGTTLHYLPSISTGKPDDL
jgi:hypothetical protein